MSVDALAAVTADDLWGITGAVWESVVRVPVARVDHAFNLDAALTGAVTIRGGWAGLVTFTCPRPAAEDVTRRMLALPDGAPVAADDVADAIGEITNVVGGQVKALCPGDNRLGLPSVATGLVATGTLPVCRLGVEWEGHVARVAVWRSATEVTDPEGRKDR